MQSCRLLVLLADDRLALWPSAFVAALFALHPLRAESVAWVSERKDVLSGLFFLLTLAAYVGYVRRQFSLARYLAVDASFALGLMAKPMLVTLPFVLLLLDYWPLNRMPLPDPVTGFPRRCVGSPTGSGTRSRISRRLARKQSGMKRGTHVIHLRNNRGRYSIVEKLPLLALSAGSWRGDLFGACNSFALPPDERIEFPLRLANARSSLLGYLVQWLYPANLAAMYPFPLSCVAARCVCGGPLSVLIGDFARRSDRWACFIPACWSDGWGIWECSCR